MNNYYNIGIVEYWRWNDLYMLTIGNLTLGKKVYQGSIFSLELQRKEKNWKILDFDLLYLGYFVKLVSSYINRHIDEMLDFNIDSWNDYETQTSTETNTTSKATTRT